MIQKISVMIVEDVPEMRLMIEELMNGMKSFRVTSSCANAAEARLEITRRRPSLVLLDEILPGESSVDLLNDFVAEQIPVVLMTGLENPGHPVPIGARFRIAKPGWDSPAQELVRIEKQLLSIFEPKTGSNHL